MIGDGIHLYDEDGKMPASTVAKAQAYTTAAVIRQGFGRRENRRVEKHINQQMR